MNVKENYLKAIHGEMPESVPVYWDGCQWFAPECIAAPVITGKPVDIYGISWTVNENGAIPTPNQFLLTDICDWREKVTIPFDLLENYDWEASVEREHQRLDPNKAVALHVHSVFNVFVNAMGFEGCLMAMAEDPDEVMEFFDTLSWFQEVIIEKSLKYYDFIDVFNITDDIATARGPFMSPAMYREMILPFHKRQIELSRKLRPEVLVEMHCCGKCDMFIDNWVNLGVNIWQPAQSMNDLKGIKKKYGTKLVLNGAWDTSGIPSHPGTTEDMIRQLVREVIDEFAPGGGYVFWDAGPVGQDKEMLERLDWIEDEARKYGTDYYKK